LGKNNILIKNMIGFASDNANVMIGESGGVISYLK